jgi:hypothetical protein
MLSILKSKQLAIEKLEVFDGSVSDYSGGSSGFDLLFIDGEHTDWACFRDFIYGIQLMKKDAIIAFHDSRLIWKSLKIIQEYLNSTDAKYKFLKVRGSKMSCVLLGSYASNNVAQRFEIVDDLEGFYLRSEAALLQMNVRNQFDARSLSEAFFAQVIKASRERIKGARRRLEHHMR